jgi:beta-galactosidase
LFQNGSLPQVLPTANGESDISNLKKCIDTYYPGGPYMVAEYYPGWLDHWGEDFITVSPEESVGQVRKYLENGISFNIYMVHGGTNFGFTSGANYNSESDIQPDLTSYDYDAPISEAGWATSKYLLLRQEYQRFSQEPLPDIPIPIPVINLPTVQFNKTVDFFDWKNRISPVKANNPLCFEDLNQGSGYVLYSRQFTQPIQGTLEITGLRDYALVYVNGEKISELNRMNKNYQMEVDIPSNGTLEILVENMGRINYGAEIVHNKKGIISPVTINNTKITGEWEMYPIPMSTPPDPAASTVSTTPGNPAFYFARFDLDQTGDVFLDMSRWGKGIVFVNGHHLGRYWNIGPQQTLYLPGCWLKNNENEVVIFEQQNDTLQKELLSSPVPMLKELRRK